MSNNRESDVNAVFVSIAGSLATGRDVVELVVELTTECARLLDIASAGLVLADGLGELHVLAASSERTRELELFQLQRAEGPCLDTYRSGEPISVEDLAAAEQRWPQFVPAALAAGFGSVHCLPLRLRDQALGALGLFGTSPGALNPRDLELGQALADIASIALVQNSRSMDQGTVIDQLQAALSSRVLIEQAKGVLAHRGNVEMEQAFAVLRRYARDHNLRLSELAGAVVDRTLAPQQLLDHVNNLHVSPRD